MGRETYIFSFVIERRKAATEYFPSISFFPALANGNRERKLVFIECLLCIRHYAVCFKYVTLMNNTDSS